MTTPPATALIESLIDPRSWRSWDRSPDGSGDDAAYAAQRAKAAQRSGAEESVVTGEASLDGMRAAFVVGEFGYLAGSIGHDAADRIVAAYDRAAAEGLPIIAATASAGTRMQEGTPAFLRMAGIAAAAAEHRRAGLPALVLLRGPTTGGVLATWGSLGQVCMAEPGALVGFLGPRVFEEVMGEPFPAGVQTAEHLVDCGVVDRVVAPDQWRAEIVTYLRIAAARPGVPPGWAGSGAPAEPITVVSQEMPPTPPHPDPHAWTHVEVTRSPDRPGAADLLQSCSSDHWPLAGSGSGDPAAGLIIGPARIHGRGAIVIAQDRVSQGAGRTIGPWSLRAARRAIGLAAELALPLVTVIDTPGAELSPAAEEGAMAGEIARSLADLALVPVPTVSVLLGQGTGGGAIALLPCDRVIAVENAWVTPLPPEGAAAIVHRDAGRAPQMAAEQRITAAALAAVGAVDTLLPEVGDWLAATGTAVAAAIDALAQEPAADRLAERRARWRTLRRY